MIRRGFDRAICPDDWGGGAKHIIKMSSNGTMQDNVFVINGFECGNNIEVKVDENGKIKKEEHRSY
jgi:hypothetical protein